MKNLNTVTILAICISISFSLASAQIVPEIQWQNTIGGSDWDPLYSVIQTTDGGYLLGGYSTSDISGDKTEANQGDNDYWVVKLDGSGNVQWQNTIGGNEADYLYSVIQTTDGGYLLGGFSFSGISGDKTEASQGVSDYWVVKLDGTGNILWQNTIGGNDLDILVSVIETTDDGYLLGGWSLSGTSGDKTEANLGYSDYWVVKLDGSGNILWQNTIGGNVDDDLYAVIETTDGDYLLVGSSASPISEDKTEANQGSWDYWMVKLDGTGNILWQNTIGCNNSDYLTSVIETTDGGYLLGGYSNSGISGDKTEASQGYFDYWVVKLDGSGNILWQNTIGGNYEDWLFSVIQTTDGGYLLGGYSASPVSGDKTEASQGYFDYWVVKLDGSGNILWQNTIGGNIDDILLSVIQSTDGGYLLGGYSYSGISGDKTEEGYGGTDYWAVKLSSEGEVECQLPVSLSANNLTPTAAKLQWNAETDAIGFKVYYHPATVPEGIKKSSNTNSKVLKNLTPNTKYKWAVQSICGTQPLNSSPYVMGPDFTTPPLRLGEDVNTSFKMEIFPNPASEHATISFSLYEKSPVVIQILDVNGRSLKVISKMDFSAGNHEVTFHRESLVAGIYFLQLKTNEGVMMKKLVME